MNKFTGVLGVYNCQGAAWSNTERKNAFHQTTTEALTDTIRGHDIHLTVEVATDPTRMAIVFSIVTEQEN